MEVRANLRGIFLTVVLCVLALVLSTCGGRKSAMNPPSIGSGGFQAAEDVGSLEAAPPTEVSLDEALAELDALDTPEGVDAALFAQLKDALREALICRVRSRAAPTGDNAKTVDGGAQDPALQGALTTNNEQPTTARFASSPPTGATNRIDDLACFLDEEESYVLSWLYRNCGDYDQNGAVGISDITPIAIHFGEDATPDNEWIDGDSDGRVHISDITPIAMNFGANVHHYSIQGSHFFSSQFTETAQLEFPEGAANDARLIFEHSLGAEPEYLYWRVVPVDDEGNPGDASNTTEVSAAPPPPVRILSVNPLGGVTGTEVTFSAVVSGEPPFDYEWDFGGGATPNESTEASPTVTLGAVDAYDAQLSVENAEGSAVKNFTLTVTAEPGEPPEIVSVSPTEGDSGTEATFVAEVTGDGPFTYYWDFAGGASPNQSSGVSDQPSATVTLSRGGTLPEPVVTYPASLTVTNPFGMSTHDFDLNISAWWHVEELPPVPGFTGSPSFSYFAFAPDGTLYAAYTYDVGGYWEAVLAHLVVDSWYVDELPALGPLAVDSEGNPGIAYNNEIGFVTDDLHFARKANSTWEDERIDAAYRGARIELMFDTKDDPLIVYARRLSIDSSDLRVAQREAGEWILTEVRDAGPEIGDLSAFLRDGCEPGIAFSTSDAPEDYDLFYATEDAGGWDIQKVRDGYREDHVLAYEALQVTADASGRPLILFNRSDRGWPNRATLFVGTGSQDGWHFEEIAAYEHASHARADLAVLPSGLKVMLYFDYGAWFGSEERVSWFGWSSGAQWHFEELPISDLGFGSILLHPSGRLTIARHYEIASYW